MRFAIFAIIDLPRKDIKKKGKQFLLLKLRGNYAPTHNDHIENIQEVSALYEDKSIVYR